MNSKNIWLQPKRLAATTVLGAMLLQATTPAFAVSPGYTGFVSQLPGVYATPPDVNVMFTLDDSGSMLSDAIPDYLNDTAGMPTDDASSALPPYGAQFPGMWGDGTAYWSTTYYQSTNANARYLRSSDGNPLYYNPKVTYRPWPSQANDQAFKPNASVNAVNISAYDPFDTSWQVDLTVRVGGKSSALDNETKNFWPATYYVYTGATSLPFATPNTGLNLQGNFTKVEIKPSVATYARAATRTDCTGPVGPSGCLYAQELQNFANWLQYYRSRLLMAKGGVAAAFAKQGTNLRVGFGTINSSGTVRQGVATFQGARRTSFYNDLYPRPNAGGTPLRRAMDDVGKYFQRSDIGNPWAEDPTSTTTNGTEYTCRRSFHILSTDGFWNGNGASGSAANNNDSFSGNTPAKPNGTTYSFSNTGSSSDPLVGRFTIDPFKDSKSDTLADVAAYYWRTDLRTDLANEVFPSSRDPAFWQHLTTFTVGLGVTGTGTVTKAAGGIADLSTQAARDLLVANKTALNWPTINADDPKTGDDLVHASMNGRGRYFSATNPTDLANGLAGALAEVTDQPIELAGVSADSPQVRSGGRVYQSTFSPNKWYGRLYAFNQDPVTGVVNNTPSAAAWEASNMMPAPASRNIYTFDGVTRLGLDFTWGGLNALQKTYLNNDPTLLDYLRGSATGEVANGGAFRDRSRYTVGAVTGGVLGDVVNGSPIKGPDAGGSYERLPTGSPGQSSYAAFRSGSGLDNMRNSIFLAANDGMLHAFGMSNGVERFAFVPNAVFNVPRSTTGGLPEQKLKMLADPTYTHRFTVDGPPNVGDAYIGGNWKTILVGSTGAGARAMFAMDVTNPAVGVGGFGTGKILWEFSDSDNTDMGFVTGYAHVVRMRDGSWAAIFGNGYDSVNGQAKLFILNLQSGAVIRQIAVGPSGENGLSAPNFVLNANREVETIYAGDLKGNLWKFDVSSTDPLAWNVAFSGTPLFTATNAAGDVQPISVMPEITAHPSGGAVVSFGTGKLFELSDTLTTSANVNLKTQSLYGIWDKPLETFGITGARATVLQAQTANGTITPPAGYQATTANAVGATKRGWYIDLASGGERSNINPQQVKSVLFMVANKPVAGPCLAGGTARILALDPVTGGAPTFAVFDTNGNGTFDDSEKGVNVKLITNGVVTQPIFQLPAVASYSAPTGVTTGPIPLFDRGQTSAARTGGVELSRSSGGSLGSGIANECALLMAAAFSDTSLMSQYIQTCTNPPPGPGAKPRISWRQLQ